MSVYLEKNNRKYMFIDARKLDKVLKTSRISVSDEQKEYLLEKLNEEFTNIDIVLDADTEGYEPLANPNENNVLEHKDEVADGDKIDEIMKNAPSSLYNYFVVPKVIKGGE